MRHSSCQAHQPHDELPDGANRRVCDLDVEPTRFLEANADKETLDAVIELIEAVEDAC